MAGGVAGGVAGSVTRASALGPTPPQQPRQQPGAPRGGRPSTAGGSMQTARRSATFVERALGAHADEERELAERAAALHNIRVGPSTGEIAPSESLAAAPSASRSAAAAAAAAASAELEEAQAESEGIGHFIEERRRVKVGDRAQSARGPRASLLSARPGGLATPGSGRGSKPTTPASARPSLVKRQSSTMSTGSRLTVR